MIFSFNPEMTLENSAVILSPLKITDINNLLPIALSNRNLLQFSPSPIYSKELLCHYIEKAIYDRQKMLRYPFIIFDKKKMAFAGSTSFLNVSNSNSRLEIGGTWIGKEFQRTGVNRNCKYLMLNFGFNKISAERIEFKTDERNLQSRTAIEKIGGIYEGILRSHTLMSDGFRRNTVCYSILKDEWQKLGADFLRFGD